MLAEHWPSPGPVETLRRVDHLASALVADPAAGPDDRRASFQALIRRQAGVIRRADAQLLLRGSVRRRVETGRWQAPRPGILVLHSGPLSVDQRRWVDL